METVTPAETIDYARGVLGYCVGVFFLAAIPLVVAFVITSATPARGSGLLLVGSARVLGYGIAAAGLAGVAFKAVADGVATARRSTTHAGDDRPSS